MGRDESSPVLPPRVKAAFDYLHHARMVTEQVDASVPMRALTALEKSVEAAALRVVQQYLLGEMEFVETTEEVREEKRGDEGTGEGAGVVNA